MARPGENVAIHSPLCFSIWRKSDGLGATSPPEYVRPNMNIEKDVAQRLRYALRGKEKHKPLC